MRTVRLRRGFAAAGFVLALCFDAAALDSGEAQGRAQLAVSGVESDMGKPPTRPKFLVLPPTPAERIAAGDMLLRTKDYDRAIEALEKVLELHRQGKASEAAYA